MMSEHPMLNVLLPLDGSIPGDTSLMAIHPLIRSGPVKCTLLHVAECEDPPKSLMTGFQRHREVLESLGVPTQVRIVSGKPSEEILRQTAGGEFDLVAMSTHGRRGMDRVLMGSVAEEVVRRSTVPTLLCRMGTFAPNWERIVVALSGLAGAEEVLEDVVGLARRLGASVHLLTVGLNLLRSNSYRGVSFEVPEDESSTYLDSVASRLLAAGIRVTADRRSGFAADQIACFAKELEAGLICMTTEGRPEEMPGLDHSVAAEVIRQAPCPVYVRRMSAASCRSR